MVADVIVPCRCQYLQNVQGPFYAPETSLVVEPKKHMKATDLLLMGLYSKGR